MSLFSRTTPVDTFSIVATSATVRVRNLTTNESFHAFINANGALIPTSYTGKPNNLQAMVDLASQFTGQNARCDITLELVSTQDA